MENAHMPAAESASPRWFEDFRPGDVSEFGDLEMTEAEILAFAGRYDPQVFHIDPEAAKANIYGGVIASGWHTAAAMMRLLVENFIPPRASLGSPGVDELRWLRPVRPGDRLRVRVTVQDAAASRSRPDRGVVRSFIEVLNQQGEVVMTLRGMLLFRRRPPAAEG
jgi:acyl dehydratase